MGPPTGPDRPAQRRGLARVVDFPESRASSHATATAPATATYATIAFAIATAVALQLHRMGQRP